MIQVNDLRAIMVPLFYFLLVITIDLPFKPLYFVAGILSTCQDYRLLTWTTQSMWIGLIKTKGGEHLYFIIVFIHTYTQFFYNLTYCQKKLVNFFLA